MLIPPNSNTKSNIPKSTNTKTKYPQIQLHVQTPNPMSPNRHKPGIRVCRAPRTVPWSSASRPVERCAPSGCEPSYRVLYGPRLLETWSDPASVCGSSEPLPKVQYTQFNTISFGLIRWVVNTPKRAWTQGEYDTYKGIRYDWAMIDMTLRVGPGI